MSGKPSTPPRRLLLVVIDGLGRSVFDRAVREGHAPMLSSLLEAGAHLGTSVSPFPSLTPVCMASLVTGSSPAQHRIPSLSWFHRGEQRFVEYGSSLRATSVEGTGRAIEDVVVNLNHVHLSHDVLTLFEEVEDAGGAAACVNCLVFRGRTRHSMKWEAVARVARRTGMFDAVYGPRHFFHGELFGPPMGMVRPQIGVRGIRDRSATHVGRWVMRNTSADFVLLYLGEHDVVAHRAGPDDVMTAVRVADNSVERVVESMGGLDRFLDECGLIVVADHGQTKVETTTKIHLHEALPDMRLFAGSRRGSVDLADVAVCPSNRFAMVYRLRDSSPACERIGRSMLEHDGVDVVAWREADELVVGRGSCWLRARPAETTAADGAVPVELRPTERWHLDGDPAALDLTLDRGIVEYGIYPDALARIDSILHCVNAGDVVASAAVGWEFVDIGGQHHGAGGSHGSLHETDSLAPMLTMGLHGQPEQSHPSLRLSEVAALVRGHLGLPESD